MQSLARFSLQAPVCDALCDLINNLSKPVHSGRKMFIIPSFCVVCEEVSTAGEGCHRSVQSAWQLEQELLEVTANF